MNVAILGATDKPDRYAYMAFQLLREKAHIVFPVHPRLQVIDGVKVFSSLNEIPQKIHTLTLYIGKAHSDKVAGDIIALKPERIIFNPGAENDELDDAARRLGIATLQACTLVLLRTGQF